MDERGNRDGDDAGIRDFDDWEDRESGAEDDSDPLLRGDTIGTGPAGESPSGVAVSPRLRFAAPSAAPEAAKRLSFPTSLPTLRVRTVLLAWAFVPLVFFAMFREGQVDPDLWWHLKAGQWMLQHGHVPHHEFFSYTAPGHVWVAHEWLTEIVFWLLYRVAGMWGLVALQGLMAAATLALLYLVIHGVCERPGPAAVSTWLVGLACFPFWRVRPHLFTFFLLTLVFALAFFYVQGYRRVVWLFPPLIVLWVNLHGGYAVGLGVGLALMGYEAVRCLVSRHVPARAAATRCRTLAAAAALGILAVALNPNGARMWIYPFEYLGHSSYTRGIWEWRAPDFASGEFAGFEILLLVGLAALALSHRRPHLPALIACIALLHQSLVVLRYIPLFALCFGPILGWHLCDLRLPIFLARAAPRRRVHRVDSGDLFIEMSPGDAAPSGERPFLNLALLALLPAFLVSLVIARLAEPAVTDRAYPAEALRRMDVLGIQGNMLNDYKWGGYLLFHAYPHRRVFVDGRADAYPAPLMDDYLRVSRLKPGWREVLNRHGVQTVLWTAESPLTEALRLDPTWELRYTDPVAALFTRRATQGPASAGADGARIGEAPGSRSTSRSTRRGGRRHRPRH